MKIAELVKRAALDSGLIASSEDYVDGELFRPIVQQLRTLISRLNAQSEIAFGRTVINTVAGPDGILFDASGTAGVGVVTSIVPVVAPKLISGQTNYQLCDIVAVLSGASGPYSYAFDVFVDSSKITLPSTANGVPFVLVCNTPITMDDEDTGSVNVPELYFDYIAAYLAEEVAGMYQMHDTKPVMADNRINFERRLATLNTGNVPVRRNVMASLNKYNNCGRQFEAYGNG